MEEGEKKERREKKDLGRERKEENNLYGIYFFSVLFFGMGAIAVVIFHIHAHNVWGTFPQILVSLFGWSLLFKGIMCTAFPNAADRWGDWALHSRLVPHAGWMSLILGAYLAWIGYFM